MPLADYVSKNGAFTGIHGTYLWRLQSRPGTAYPQCGSFCGKVVQYSPNAGDEEKFGVGVIDFSYNISKRILVFLKKQ